MTGTFVAPLAQHSCSLSVACYYYYYSAMLANY